ncbi:MAG: hypothetical protein ACRC35_02745 [Angustibacter sp.]
MMRAYGRDVPGAAIFVPHGAPDPTVAGRYQRIDLRQLRRRLRDADRYAPARPPTRF